MYWISRGIFSLDVEWSVTHCRWRRRIAKLLLYRIRAEDPMHSVNVSFKLSCCHVQHYCYLQTVNTCIFQLCLSKKKVHDINITLDHSEVNIVEHHHHITTIASLRNQLIILKLILSNFQMQIITKSSQ